jgi:hypothetical protein
MALRYASYTQALQTGWMCKDEVRAKENMAPIPGGKGKEYLETPVGAGANKESPSGDDSYEDDDLGSTPDPDEE